MGHDPPPTPDLTRDELLRYGRHLSLPEVGVEGQRRLKASRVLLVGAGGLGSPVALYLAAAGIGRIGVVDFDAVDLSNLQRQVLHGTAAVGRPKVDSARERLADLNPQVEVVPHPVRLTSANALAIVGDYDLVVDGTDNFATRYLVNDACVLLGKPNVYASVYRFEGQATVFATRDGPCYRCVHPRPPEPGLVPSCAEGGVLGILPGLLGLVQATEAVKLAAGLGEPLVGRLLLVDALRMEFRTVRIRRDPRCPACGTREIQALADYEAFCGTPREAPMSAIPTITVTELAERRRRGDDVALLDVREPHEWNIGRIEGARLVPLKTLPEAIDTLDRERDLVVYCRTGGRSARAVAYLQQLGFGRVWNLAGGIHAWSQQIDPSIPQY
jgi:adenylyltransferase/sulfurtransferase